MLRSFRFITWGVFVLYILVLVNVIILKDGKALAMAKFGRKIPFSKKLTFINFTPFVNTIIPYLELKPYFSIAVQNLLGNIFAFSPLGFFLPLLFKSCNRLKTIFLISIGVSLFIELIQLVFYLGSCDIDDLILNVLGSILGYGVYYLLKTLYNRKSEVTS